MGFREKGDEVDQKSAELLIHTELKREFSPEFINRIDEVIIFNPLTDSELRAICQLLIDDVNIAILQKNVQIAVDESVVKWLLAKAREESNSGAISRRSEEHTSELQSQSNLVC